VSSDPQRRYRTALTVATATIAAIGLASWPLTSTGSPTAPGLTAVQLGKGDFLVASRDLRDPSFSRTVVLLLEHGPEGTLGLIVNRPTTMKLAALLPDMEGLDERDDEVYAGGPVLPGAMLMLVRSDRAPSESPQVLEGVYYSGNQELLAELVRRGGDGEPFRVYAGHAGWAPGQLEWEVRRRSWHVVPGDGAVVFDEEPLELWDKMIRRSMTLLAALRIRKVAQQILGSGSPTSMSITRLPP
jgi:putative transcriptional regulator